MRVGNCSDSAELLHHAKYVTSLLVFLMVPEIKGVESDHNNNTHINFLPIFHEAASQCNWPITFYAESAQKQRANFLQD